MRGIGVIVLCGGESRRMGRPKAWLEFGGEKLLQRVVRLASEAAATVVVVAAPGQDLPGLHPSVRVVRDAVKGQGPLQGLATGLAELPESVELAFLTATDVPFLKPAWIPRLAELIREVDLVMPRHDGFLQPMAALYRRAPVRQATSALLDEGRMRPAFLVERVASAVVEAEQMRDVDPDLGTLRNLNTPEDYRDALAAAGLREGGGTDGRC